MQQRQTFYGFYIVNTFYDKVSRVTQNLLSFKREDGFRNSKSNYINKYNKASVLIENECARYKDDIL